MKCYSRLQNLKTGVPFRVGVLDVLDHLHICSLHSYCCVFAGTECGRDETNIEHHSKLNPEKG
jgi:hypothetical protein